MKTEILTTYAPDSDITFIMINTYDEFGEPIATECAGWYYGEPNQRNTDAYIGNLKAKYD